MILTLLGSLWTRISTQALVAISAFSLAMAVYFTGRSHGKQAAKQDALATDLENIDVRSQTERTVSRDPDPVGRLRKDWSRP